MENAGLSRGQNMPSDRTTKLRWLQTLQHSILSNEELRKALQSDLEAHKAKNRCKPNCVFCQAFEKFIEIEKQSIADDKAELRDLLRGRR